MIKLGVNIDHVATVRQARGGDYPSVLKAAEICDRCHVNGITMHLREDRRHIQDKDIYDIKKNISTKLNLEMAISQDVINVALDVVPSMATIVPEKRQEVTTEGGLDVKKHYDVLTKLCCDFNKKGIDVSLFIEPDFEIIDLSKKTGAKYVEFHTGAYAEADNEDDVNFQLERLLKAADYSDSIGLINNAGHGLNYNNTLPILKMKNLNELNIGHSIVSRALFIGLENAVMEMKNLIENGVMDA